MASEVGETYELWMSPANIPAAWEALLAAGAKPVGAEALEMFRVWAGVPRYGRDIRDRELPQETEQTHALHFSKGCYVGQEIVERIHARGQVHRKFSGFIIDGAPPEPMTSGGKRALAIFGLTALLWVLRADIDLGGVVIPGWAGLLGLGKNVDDGVVAVARCAQP